MRSSITVWFLALAVSLLPTFADAQAATQWRRYQDSTLLSGFLEASAVTLAPATGNIYVTGYTKAGATRKDDIYVAKYTATGTLSWIRYYDSGFSEDDRGTCIAVDASENVFVGGWARIASNGQDFLTVKYDTAGVFQWARSYHGGNTTDIGQDIGVDPAGNIVITGESVSPGGFFGVATVRYSQTGSQQYVRRLDTVPTANVHTGAKLAIDGVGNVFIGCSTIGSPSGDMCVARYGPTGTFAWRVQFDGAVKSDVLKDIEVGTDGVYVCGQSIAADNLPELAVGKCSFDGGIIWYHTRRETPSTSNVALALAVNPSGDAFVTGATFPGNSDIVTAKYTSAGVFQWAVKESSTGFDQGLDIAADQFGNCYVGGIKFGGGSTDAFVARYNASGARAWSALVDNAAGNDFNTAIAVDSNGNVVLAGWAQAPGPKTLMCVQKFWQAPVAINDSYSGAVEGNPRIISAPGLFGNDWFTGGSTASLIGSPTRGTVTINANGSFTYTAAIGQAGTDRFTYRGVKGAQNGNIGTAAISISRLVPTGLSFSPSTIYAGQSTTGTFTANGKAWSGGVAFAITLGSSVFTGPANATIASGLTSASFVVSAGFVSTTSTRTVSVVRAGVTRSASITINPSPAMTMFTITPNAVVSGNSTTGRIELASAAPTGGLPVAISTTSGSISVPATVTVPAGAASVTFTINTTHVTSSVVRQVTARLNGVTINTNLTLNP